LVTAEQFKRIEPLLQVQRGNVSISNLQVVNAILFVAESDCKWRALPKRLGNWHTTYTRMNRWAKAGVLDRLFEGLQHQQLVRIRIEAVSLDSTIVKVHPDGTGALEKSGAQAIGRSRGGWTTGIHIGCRGCSLRHCDRADPGPVGRCARCRLIMDRAYEGNETRQPALDLGFIPVVPPHPLRTDSWTVKKAWYRRRNEIERLFRRLKGSRRIFSRVDTRRHVRGLPVLCARRRGTPLV
jgi:transposase